MQCHGTWGRVPLEVSDLFANLLASFFGSPVPRSRRLGCALILLSGIGIVKRERFKNMPRTYLQLLKIA